MVTPVEDAVAIINSMLHSSMARTQVQFADKPTIVSMLRQQSRHHHLVLGNPRAVLSTAGGARVTPRQERGTAWRANGTLAVGTRERYSFRYESVEVRRPNVRITEALNCIPTLLIGAEPEDVGHVWQCVFFSWARTCLRAGPTYAR